MHQTCRINIERANFVWDWKNDYISKRRNCELLCRFIDEISLRKKKIAMYKTTKGVGFPRRWMRCRRRRSLERKDFGDVLFWMNRESFLQILATSCCERTKASAIFRERTLHRWQSRALGEKVGDDTPTENEDLDSWFMEFDSNRWCDSVIANKSIFFSNFSWSILLVGGLIQEGGEWVSRFTSEQLILGPVCEGEKYVSSPVCLVGDLCIKIT